MNCEDILEKIKSLVGSNEPSPGYGEGFESKNKPLIIIPHTVNSKGAKSCKGQHEYDYYLDVFYDVDVDYITRNGGDKKIREDLKALVKDGFTTTIEPHFNAFNKKAKGVEILVLKGDTESEQYALDIIEHFNDFLSFHKPFHGLKIRRGNGIKYLSTRKDRGYSNLKRSKECGMKIAVLTELFFGDNPNDYLEAELVSRFFKQFLS